MTDTTLIPVKCSAEEESNKGIYDTPYLAISGGDWYMVRPFYGNFMADHGYILDADEIDELYRLPEVKEPK